LIALVGLMILAAIGCWKYGSLSSAILASRGYALAVDPDANNPPAVLTAGAENVIQVRVRNLRSEPVAILGAEASCRCSSVSNLPLTVPPGGSIDLPVTITAADSDVGSRLSAKIVLYVDVASPPVLFRVPPREVVATANLPGRSADP
jgi:hypothetical protein